MFKVIVAGSRDFNDYEFLCETLDKELLDLTEANDIIDDIQIVSGTAKGADKLGERYAKQNQYSVQQFPADWNTFGKKAGYIRNEEMAKYADACICFWDGESRGTKHMIDLAKKYNLLTKVVLYNNTKENENTYNFNIINGNIFDYIGDADVICATTNGIVKANGELVMGAGVAKAFADKYPDMPNVLGKKVKANGNIVYQGGEDNGTLLLSFPTKNNFKDNADINLIIKSAKRLLSFANKRQWKKIIIPSPGTGLGELSKEEVYNELNKIFDDRFYIITK